MKTKITFLIALSLFYVSISKAQYGAPCADNRIVIQGQFAIPGAAVISYNYNQMARGRYDRRADDDRYHDQREWRDHAYNQYDNHRDWREIEYDRYCHETRGYRMSRETFYRDHCSYHAAPRQVNVYRY